MNLECNNKSLIGHHFRVPLKEMKFWPEVVYEIQNVCVELHTDTLYNNNHTCVNHAKTGTDLVFITLQLGRHLCSGHCSKIVSRPNLYRIHPENIINSQRSAYRFVYRYIQQGLKGGPFRRYAKQLSFTHNFRPNNFHFPPLPGKKISGYYAEWIMLYIVHLVPAVHFGNEKVVCAVDPAGTDQRVPERRVRDIINKLFIYFPFRSLSDRGFHTRH